MLGRKPAPFLGPWLWEALPPGPGWSLYSSEAMAKG